jgi:hypothetical protein
LPPLRSRSCWRAAAKDPKVLKGLKGVRVSKGFQVLKVRKGLQGLRAPGAIWGRLARKVRQAPRVMAA